MKPEPEASKPEVLAGLVERVTYYNTENGFCVLRAKARGHRDQSCWEFGGVHPLRCESTNGRPGKGAPYSYRYIRAVGIVRTRLGPSPFCSSPPNRRPRADRECTSGRARNWASCSPLAGERGRVFPLSGGPSKHGSLFQGLRLAVMPSAPGTPMRLFLAYAIRLNCPASATTQTVSREGAAGGVHACPHRCNACLFRIIRWRAGRQFAFWRRVEQAQPIDCSGSGRRLLRNDHACSAAPAARAVSFPKIISARSYDAVLTKSAQRRWPHAAG